MAAGTPARRRVIAHCPPPAVLRPASVPPCPHLIGHPALALCAPLGPPRGTPCSSSSSPARILLPWAECAAPHGMCSAQLVLRPCAVTLVRVLTRYAMRCPVYVPHVVLFTHPSPIASERKGRQRAGALVKAVT
ncbi:hypothetical protein HYPSUDRAFT_1054156 [Hypholoma sublateritium FD-334 SS-4]|uniref:Uncharacterized protein n=1 Tax=Hypholoma sublateritium (strain FD-334 SS-4) TaxID=945553 RepID=A0A0D2NJY2_HYPSF|nr:hypothetical protein HYPSUDRAFT_1054156 [Hypholoma sublateritium FD-334 SS-4]